MITELKLLEKNIEQLTFEEMAFVHLNTSYSPILVKNGLLRSTLSFIHQNIQHSLVFDYSKQLMPYLSLCAILDQLGSCYDRNDKPNHKYTNGIKRALVNFGELNENDDMIDVLYILRNGLIHNVSLTSYDKFNKKHYIFRYNSDIESIYQKAEVNWNGDYEALDNNREKFVTHINVEKLRDLVFNCVQKAYDLNQTGNLVLRLQGGVRQLFYDYIQLFPRL